MGGGQFPFDRLYFYDFGRPIHVSFGPNQDRQIVWMVRSKSGRLVLMVASVEEFLNLS